MFGLGLRKNQETNKNAVSLFDEPGSAPKLKLLKSGKKKDDLDEALRMLDTDLIGEPVNKPSGKGTGVRKSKAEKAIEFIENKPTLDNTNSVLLKIGGEVVNRRLEALGTEVEDIKKFQLFRIIKTLVIFIVPLFIALALKSYIPVFVSILGAIAMWFYDYLRVAKEYEGFQFKRQLDFNKFVRMLMPYLRGNNVVLYKALEKMKDRLDEGTTRTSLIALMTKINMNPNSRLPYEEFAESSSGQERSKLIMQTLYDFQRSSNDSTTINELGKLIDDELSKDIDEIITRKDDKFESEAYLLGSLIMIPAFGYFIAYMYSTILQIFPMMHN